MLHFILLGLLAPLLRAITNYIDKTLLNKVTYPTKHIIPMLMIFSGIIGIIPIIIFLIIGRKDVSQISIIQISTLMAVGCCHMIGIYLYLKALNTDTPTNVIPYFQLIPLFALIIGYYMFGEIIAGYNLLGCILVVLGAILLSTNLKTYHFNGKTITMMAISSLFFTISDALFRNVYVSSNFTSSILGTSIAITIIGLGFLCIKKYRIGFIKTIKQNGKKLLMMNSINEILNISAKLVFFYLTAYLFLAHLELINSLQPLFIVIIGFLLSKTFPEKYSDYRSKEESTKQIISIFIMSIGVLLITL